MIRLWSILLLSLVLFSCENDLDTINELFQPLEPGIEIARDVDMLYSDSAFVRVRIQGATLKRYTDDVSPRDEFPDGVHVDFLERQGTVSSTLDAKHGTRYTREKKVIVRDSVILQNDRGEKLETNELIWDEVKREVYTDRFVRITKPDEIILAYGFRANQEFTEYELNTVVAQIKADEFTEEFKN